MLLTGLPPGLVALDTVMAGEGWVSEMAIGATARIPATRFIIPFPQFPA